MFETLGIFMRWLHIASVATLIGGMLYGWLVLVPATGVLAAEARKALVDRTAALFRPLVFGAIAALLVSGGYNLAINPGHQTRYYILLSLKLLLVAHVFAVGMVLVTKNPEHRGRLFSGAVISRLLMIFSWACPRLNDLSEQSGDGTSDVGLAHAKLCIVSGMHARGGVDECLARPWI